jgi:signal transduction histidine kinase
VRGAALAVVIGAGAALGILAERQAYAWNDVRGWLPDLLAGWILIGLGLALLVTSRTSVAAALMLAAGFSWFLFNFSTAGSPVDWPAARAAYVHRGALLALAFVLLGRRALVPAALACAAAVAWPLWDDDASAIVLAAAFSGTAAVYYRRARGRRRRALAGRTLAAVAVLCLAVAAGSVRSLAGAPQAVTDATVLAYAVAAALTGILLFSAATSAAPTAFVDQAVALERGGMRLRDVLRDLLGDPELELSFAGAAPGPPGPERKSTDILVSGRRAGALVHESGSLDDEQTRIAVLAAAGLAAERARLRGEVEARADEITASRRRLLLAEEDERRRLAAALERSAGAALDEIDRLLAEARPSAAGALTDALDRAAAQSARVRPELDGLVRGLGGVEPSGLADALERLAADLPVPVELDLADVRLTASAASAIWFVSAESLANVVKHADAHLATLSLLEEGGVVRLRVEDDGRGGADPAGWGLVGLADRVSAIGGVLSVDSPSGAGTCIEVELPALEASV